MVFVAWDRLKGFLLLVCFALALVGCGSGGDEKEQEAVAKDEPAEKAKPAGAQEVEVAPPAVASPPTTPSRANVNPLIEGGDTPYGIPPFDDIRVEHFQPAVSVAIAENREEITAISTSSEEPTFANTVTALEISGRMLDRVAYIFSAYTGMLSTPELRAIEAEVSGAINDHQQSIHQNQALYERIKEVYRHRKKEDLSDEQIVLLRELTNAFEDAGADLEDETERVRFKEIEQRLTKLSITFGQNVLKSNDAYRLQLNENQLDGLPESVLAIGRKTAQDLGLEGWVYTLHRSSITPFLSYSSDADLRRQIYTAYVDRAKEGELDNRGIILEMVRLRAERAKLLGHKTHADAVIRRNMAHKVSRVRRLLNDVWDPALKAASREAEELRLYAESTGEDTSIEPWDWWFFAEKLRQARYEIDESRIREYFALDATVKGMFGVAENLFGIRFRPLDNVRGWVPSVRTWEVINSEGEHLGIYMLDPFSRTGKRDGAWMTVLREQSRVAGEVRPLVLNVANFAEGSSDKPVLMSFEEAETLFHEFGHALQGLLSDVTYGSLAGTSVKRDFVEFPSQLLERWLSRPEVLQTFARHYETGEVIPQELIDALARSRIFNQGFATVEYLGATEIDLNWHGLQEDDVPDNPSFVEQLDSSVLEYLGVIREIDPRYYSPYFQHIFSGGYSAGYYSYIWADAMVADAYELFEERGIYDPELASKLERILSVGGSVDPEELFRDLRGRSVKVGALLRHRGLE